MCVTDSGMVKFSKEMQWSKARSPMWVTELAMVKLTNKLQL